MRHDAFSELHPAVELAFFTAVLTPTMICDHPAVLAISLVCAAAYAVQTAGGRAVRLILSAALPMLLLAALINPAFSHAGVTILCYLPSDNPLTLESILYGVAAGARFAAALLWFYSVSRVISSDKIVYLFGRVCPAIALLVSMTLRFVPRFRAKMGEVADAQRMLGRDTSGGSLFSRVRAAISVVSITVTWSLENAIGTADSMKGRGYGLRSRTAFSIYRMSERDRSVLAAVLVCAVILTGGGAAGAFAFRFFPSIKFVPQGWITAVFQAVYLVLCLVPVILNEKEARAWKLRRLA